MWLWSGEVEATGCNADIWRQTTWNYCLYGTRGVKRCQRVSNSQIWHLQFRHSAVGTIFKKETIWKWYTCLFGCWISSELFLDKINGNNFTLHTVRFFISICYFATSLKLSEMIAENWESQNSKITCPCCISADVYLQRGSWVDTPAQNCIYFLVCRETILSNIFLCQMGEGNSKYDQNEIFAPDRRPRHNHFCKFLSESVMGCVLERVKFWAF